MKLLPEELAVVKALASGRKLIRTKNLTLQWEDQKKSPSLKNSITSNLFRAWIIKPEYLQEKPHTSNNATGYVILSQTGVFHVNK